MRPEAATAAPLPAAVGARLNSRAHGHDKARPFHNEKRRSAPQARFRRAGKVAISLGGERQ
jgi:hypothetical protein